MESENLGVVASWSIRDFPVSVREMVVAEANASGETVAEFMTRHFIALRDIGWLRQTTDTPAPALAQPHALAGMALEIATVLNAAVNVAKNGEGMAAPVRKMADQLTRVGMQCMKMEIRSLAGLDPKKAAAVEALVDEASKQLRIAAE